MFKGRFLRWKVAQPGQSPLQLVQLNEIREILHQTQICPEKNVVIINDTIIADKEINWHDIIVRFLHALGDNREPASG